jgi:4-hydroxybenzoate polyprenyltransferase
MSSFASTPRAVVPDRSLPPLAVDLDGTLILADTSHEGLLSIFKAKPLDVTELAGSLRTGKAALKRKAAQGVSFDPVSLPYNQDVLSYLREQHRNGRRLGLFTSADQSIADAVAEHLDLFEVAVGSNGSANLSGVRRLAAIRECFGKSFAYAGNDARDRTIFREAHQVVLVGPVEKLRGYLPAGQVVEAVFPSRTALTHWIRAVRPEHWTKNILIFVAPTLGFHLVTPTIALQTAILFAAMSLLASAMYLVNDLFDIASDRQHPVKRFRPFAAGSLTVRSGAFAAVGLAALAFLLGTLLPPAGLTVLTAYLGVTVLYNLGLKRQPIVDVVVLAGLFTLRVLAGSLLLPSPISPWLLSFSMLFFLGLAMVKRYAELDRVIQAGGSEVISRGYSARDLPLLLASGIAAGFSSVVLFTIYLINEQYPRDIYGNPGLLWAVMPVLLVFILRVWHLAVHGKMDEDPVTFAFKDRFSLMLGALMGLVLMAAWI